MNYNNKMLDKTKFCCIMIQIPDYKQNEQKYLGGDYYG